MHVHPHVHAVTAESNNMRTSSSKCCSRAPLAAKNSSAYLKQKTKATASKHKRDAHPQPSTGFSPSPNSLVNDVHLVVICK